MFDWTSEYDGLFWWLAAGSAMTFLVSLAVLPMLVARIPEDYFIENHRPKSRFAAYHPVLRVVLIAAKNLVGGVLFLVGLVMIPLPGQGVITMLVGLLLLDVPGKYIFERWLIARPSIHRPVNWMRARHGRGPLKMGDQVGGGGARRSTIAR